MPSRCGVWASTILASLAGFGPATLEIDEVMVENQLVPWGEVARRTTRMKLAIRSDGSRAIEGSGASFHHFVFPAGQVKARLIVDASRKEFVWLTDPREPRWQAIDCPLPPVRSIEPRACAPDPSQYLGVAALGSEHSFLGFRVFGWRWPGGQEFWLAPRLHCAKVREEHLDLNRWGVPRFYWRRWVSSVKFGEPDPQLFAIAVGSRGKAAR